LQPGGGGCRAAGPPNPQNRNLKKTGFYISWYRIFSVISPSAEINHRNRLMTSTV
jgi:hypothetical protein